MGRVKWESWDEPVSIEEIKKVESVLKVKFPKEYIEIATEYHGGHVSPHLFQVEGKERVFGTLLSFDWEDVEYILEVYTDYKETLPKEMIPFAFDPAGNLICFDYKKPGNNPAIVFWEHENAWEKEMLMKEEGLTEEAAEERARENVFFIADTFLEFINQLHE